MFLYGEKPRGMSDQQSGKLRSLLRFQGCLLAYESSVVESPSNSRIFYKNYNQMMWLLVDDGRQPDDESLTV